jgi:hypothetical protein
MDCQRLSAWPTFDTAAASLIDLRRSLAPIVRGPQTGNICLFVKT